MAAEKTTKPATKGPAEKKAAASGTSTGMFSAKVSKGEGLRHRIVLTVPAAVVEARREARLAALAKTAKVDGFRPGMVPVKIVKERLGDSVNGDVAKALVQEFLPQALQAEKLNVAGQPNLQATEESLKVPASGDFEVTAEFDIYPEFEPKGFEKLKLTRDVAEPDEEMITGAMTRLEGQMATFEPAKAGAKAAMGDRVTVTGAGYTSKGGKEEAFPGGNLQDFKITMGSGQLIPGFESGLVGVKVGEHIDLKVSFPADYHAAELAGQPAVFKLDVLALETPKTGGLSEEALQQLGFKNLDDLKKVLKEGSERDLKAASDQRLKRQLLDALDSANSFAMPQGLVEAEHSALWRAQMQELQQRRLGLDALGKKPEEAIAELKPLAERRVRLGLVLAELAKRNGLTVSAKELDTAVQGQIASAGPQQAAAREYFNNPQNRQQLAGPLLEDKVTAWLLEKAEVTEKTVKAEELMSELQ